MDIGQILYELIFDYTLRTVALGAAILGLVSGVLGAFAMLRKQSLLGDAISHAALPGVALAFLISGSKEPLVLVLGAVLAGWVATLFVMLVTKQTRIKQDAALGIVLSVFFGFGLLLLTFIQRLPTASKAGLDKFLFGQAATLVQSDVVTMAILGGIAVLLVGLFWKEFKLLSFDPDFAASLGYSVRWLDVLLTTLMVLAIVVGLQTVGVVLMSAMLVAPAAAARQWTDRLDRMVLLSGFFGALVGVLGAVTSSQVAKLPTGPTIVLYMSVIVLLSLLLAPRRGIVAQFQKRRSQKVQFAAEALSVHLLHHEGSPEELAESALTHMRDHMHWREDFAQYVARWAVTQGWVAREDGHLALTSYGREVARLVMSR